MGGNATIRGREAQSLDLKVIKRNFMVPKLNALLHSINASYQKANKQPLWDPKLLDTGHFLSGSSLHFFNVADIDDKTFITKKPKVGDIDTMVDKTKEISLQQFLTTYIDRPLGPAVFRGFEKGNEQYISLWELQDPPVTVQIDFEFVDYENGSPTDWAKFSHSSSWEDLQHGVKGVFHKLLVQSLAALSKQTFYQRKMVGRGKMRSEQDIPVTDNMYSFAVSSKEGGGLRAKYEPVLGPKGRPLVTDGMPVMSATPTTGYIKDIGQIFSTLLGKRLSAQTAKQVSANFWSFAGIVDILAKLLNADEKAAVVDSLIVRTIGPGAQGLYKNDPNQDIKEKLVALNYIMQKLNVSKPKEFDQMLNTYRSAYKMTTESIELTEAPNYKRKSIPHIYNPGTTVEIKDKDFIELCKEIAQDGGTLNNSDINVKVDGAGIRFGRDQNGKPFFMTSKVNEPKYIENYGDFENYNISQGQPAERVAFAKNYDNALQIILSSNLMNAVPADTIIQAEMLFNDMAHKSKDGYKFVNINYDPKKLGKVMTLAPFMFKQYSTGEDLPNAEQIQKNLLKSSDSTIKVISNKLQQSNIDVSKIVNPIANSADGLRNALSARGDTPQKQKAREIIAHAKQSLSEAISNSPIKGKDQLGPNNEGLVITLPSGRTVKVTSEAMRNAMAVKRIAPAGPRSGRTAIVTAGSFVGHKGHEQLVELVFDKAEAIGADPYVYISPTVGPDDPIPPQMKLMTWQKLYPNHVNSFQVWQEGGTPVKKIEKELVTRTNPPPYDRVIVIVGSDRYEGFKKWMEHLSKRMKNPQYPGFEHVQFDVEQTPRNSEEGGTGITFTQCRDILENPKATEEQQLDYWCKAFDVEKLGAQWIKQLMDTARKGMGIKQMTKKEKLKEFIQRARPMLKEASIEKKLEVLSFIKESLQEVEEEFTYVEMDPRQFNDDEFYAYDPETKVIKSNWSSKSSGRAYHEKQAAENGLEIAKGLRAKFKGLLVKQRVQDMSEAGSPAQQAAIAINMKKRHQKPKHIDESQAVEVTDYDLWSDKVKELGAEIHPQKDRNLLVAQSWDGDIIGKFHLGKNVGFINQQGELDETIRKVGSQYRLLSKKGKNLGTYPSKAGAEKRERQVQYFKHANEGMSEGRNNEELANEVYAEFERIYPNLARKAHEHTVHAAIMDVLNYGDGDISALAQDVARAVKHDIQQDVSEGFNSKQEVIAHFVKQGKSAASGASAWERGWRGPKSKQKELKPPVRSYHDDLDDKRYGEKEVSETEEPFDLENRHTMDYGMRKFMIHKLARATDYERNALELASDEELRDLFQQTFPNNQLDEDYLDEK